MHRNVTSLAYMFVFSIAIFLASCGGGGGGSSSPSTVAVPDITPDSGLYTSAQTVSIGSATAGASIFYTLDDSDPTTNGTEYTGSFDLTEDQTVTVRAVAVKTGWVGSQTAMCEYIILIDTDGDGLTDVEEAFFGTDPENPDTDSDGLSDGQEINHYATDPTLADTDGDGLNDGEEVNTHGTDPTLGDSDYDGYSDKEEVEAGTDPWDDLSYPAKSWAVAELIETNTAGSADSPQIAFDSSGDAIAVWHQYDGTNFNIWANRFR